MATEREYEVTLTVRTRIRVPRTADLAADEQVARARVAGPASELEERGYMVLHSDVRKVSVEG